MSVQERACAAHIAGSVALNFMYDCVDASLGLKLKASPVLYRHSEATFT